MKKIKKFLNPLVKSMSEAAGKNEEKIVLTYRSKHGCLINDPDQLLSIIR